MSIPTARSLPYASIVAAPNARVWVKEEESHNSRYPWAATHIIKCAISDGDVDEVLQSGQAVVLRVGTGE